MANAANVLRETANKTNPAMRTEKSEKIHIDDDADMLPENPARNANILGEKKEDVNQTTIMEDTEKTLVDLENQPPSEDLPSQMSDISYDSDDNKHSRGSMSKY